MSGSAAMLGPVAQESVVDSALLRPIFRLSFAKMQNVFETNSMQSAL